MLVRMPDPNDIGLVCFQAQNHSFKTRPDLTGRPGAGTGPGLRKNRGSQNLGWLGDPVKNSVATRWILLFFTKTTSFYFFKSELTRATRWPSQNPEPRPWAGSTIGLGLKTLPKIIWFSYILSLSIHGSSEFPDSTYLGLATRWAQVHMSLVSF
jgi:hypothetical protein